ncbi:carboxypeptidase-like regulatory domain-containing protein [Hymenobacter sp. M29]|uniref:Carboxypeptidase-like regulatory domain-containing protein n=1 Tax=Hymenobacter mellowenesis TaxID=3063995 RepID=A0ABT9ABG5_9BACT|nr:carboxypeptidase-like regulatory domain-containing protein [Hymenobacter sp. M29]MDO7847196.1 carboxypeptidase-like regulatory domain-containing protein [Hymenobacter sp. M29]
MKSAFPATLMVSLCTFASCQLVSEPGESIVEGIVTDKYTKQPVDGAPVSVRRYLYGSYGNTSSDSVITVYTNSAGRYRLSFDASKSGQYRIKMRHNKRLYDLSKYSNNDDYYDGLQIMRGASTVVNFEVTPYKTVIINAHSSKKGKTDIVFSFVNYDQGDWFGGTVFYDTVKANQNFNFSRQIQVLPNRVYCFSKQTCNRVKDFGYRYHFEDYTWTTKIRTIFYNDTSVVNFD